MKIEMETGSDNRIKSYGPGELIINESRYTASLILTPQHIISDWTPQRFTELKPEHFEPFITIQPEVVIVGTGNSLRFPSAETLNPLIAHELGYEIMDTGAACRCYNILMTEGRNVAAALLMIEPGE